MGEVVDKCRLRVGYEGVVYFFFFFFFFFFPFLLAEGPDGLPELAILVSSAGVGGGFFFFFFFTCSFISFPAPTN